MPPVTTGPLTAVIVAPGGGYRTLSMNKEGRIPASYLNAIGIAAFVLKYRLGPNYHHPIEIGDMQRAIRTVRARAAEWHVNPERIGVMGFSAGGHLASTASTKFDSGNPSAADPIDRVGSRPDFAVLAYPVITLTEAWTHQGSKTFLLGDKPDPALARALSAETQVTAQTPPTFLFHTNADTTVPVENSIHYFLALRKAGVPAEMHIFKDGPHGVGMPLQDTALSEWPKLLSNWLRAAGFLNWAAYLPFTKRVAMLLNERWPRAMVNRGIHERSPPEEYQMASDIFAKLGDIKGESQDDKHKDEVEVLSFSWGVTNPASHTGGGGSATGKATFHDFSLVHNIDKATPLLLRACATGTHLQEATITQRKAGKGQHEYLIIKMNDVIVTGVTDSGATGQQGSETVTLTFAKVALEYRPQKPDGSVDSGVHFKYDIKTNKEG